MSEIPAPVSNPHMDVGVQPLDALLGAAGLSNHAVVAAAGASGLTHKVVAKARRGRRLTRRAQEKVLAAVNAARGGSALRLEECFNYRGA